ncbi:MAG: lipopolysaccharide kinase InaA family protein [Acidobacteriota bacterium]
MSASSTHPNRSGDYESFSLGAKSGELAVRWRPLDLGATVEHLCDPQNATETLFWDRNYVYAARLQSAAGDLEVAVKQFRNQGWRKRQERRFKGSKALRSWRMAKAFADAGIPTPEPVMLVESVEPEGPSHFITRRLQGVEEIRYILRAVEAGTLAEDYPQLDYRELLRRLGKLLRQMHDAGLFHRDLSIGNVLVEFLDAEAREPKTCEPEEGGDLVGGAIHDFRLYIIDLNRARLRRRVGLSERLRDLCRLRIFLRQDQEVLLEAYWPEHVGTSALGWRSALFRLYQKLFLGRIEAKKKARGGFAGLRDFFRPRRAHAHIPQAPSGADSRDKIVWDKLSDQPHQHASRWEKLTVRAADLGGHLRTASVLVPTLPKIWSRYWALGKELYQREVEFPGLGIGLRPWPENPEALLEALDDLGSRQALIRLHPWDEEHQAEEELARELSHRGWDLTFALPQNRELVRDPQRWRRSLQRLGEAFSPYGKRFQIGQAVNRSKWGVWNWREYARLAEIAQQELRTSAQVELLGPAVIDFEFHATASLLNLRAPGLEFDAVASLLYVDRRGAPESPQGPFDAVAKVRLLQAVIETARTGGGRSWVTEFNWPLWEGPHSPAGKDVSVDEQSQARYLLRYAAAAQATGWVERMYWWQLVARGYGLIAPEGEGEFRRRPAFTAAAIYQRQLQGARFQGMATAVQNPESPRWLRYRDGEEKPWLMAWSPNAEGKLDLPSAVEGDVEEVVHWDGRSVASESPRRVVLGPDPVYVRLTT